MKIQFIHLGRENLGIEYLSAILKRAGHEVTLGVDIGLFGQNDNIFYIPRLEKLFSMTEQVIEKFRREQPDIVCMSAYTSTLKWCFTVAERIKSIRSDVPVILGGIHATLAPETTLNSPAIDLAVRGEAESVILELVSRIETGAPLRELPGAIWRDNGEVKINGVAPLVEDLDSLPFPDKSLFEHVLNIRDDYMTLPSRGCPFVCTYCCEHMIKNIYGGSKYVRRRSVDSVMLELNEMKARYKFREVYFCCPVFPTEKEWAAEFSERYRREIGVPFWTFAHINFIDYEYAKLLRDAGCFMVEFGVQTVNEALRREVLKRKEPNERIARALRTCDEAGLPYDVDSIFYLPGEQEEDYDNAVRFYAGFRNIHRVKVFNLTLFPGAEILDAVLERGLIHPDTYEAIRRGEIGDFFHVADIGSPVPEWKIRACGNLLRLMPLLSERRALKWLEPRALRRVARIPKLVVRLLEMYNLVRMRDLRFILYLKLYIRHFTLFITRRRTA